MAPSSSKGGKSRPSTATLWMVYVMFVISNLVAHFIQVDQALIMTAASTFLMYKCGLFNMAILLFTMIKVPVLLCCLGTYHKDAITVMGVHSFFYYILPRVVGPNA